MPILRFAQGGLALVVAAAVLATAGCGDDSGLPQRYPVSGTVLYKGEPLPSGTIVFEPANLDTGRVASGTIENGSYDLSTSGDGPDGAMAGDYKVVVISKVVDNSGVVANQQGGAGRQEDVARAEASAERKIPKKYEQSATSGLSAKVEAQSNTIDFTLTD